MNLFLGMNWRNNDFILLIATIGLFAAAYVMKVPHMSAGDLVLVTVAGLIAVDLRGQI
jgi:hypothetical protein